MNENQDNEIYIEESNMTFGPYSKQDLFHIEKSDVYTKFSSKGIALGEFFLLRHKKKPTIFIVEAKSSAPNPEGEPNFDKFISSIQAKWINSFFLFWAIYLGRHCSKDFPSAFKKLDSQTLDFHFLLVINNFKEEWAAPLRDTFLCSKVLSAMCSAWRINPMNIIVYNDIMARNKCLIK
jgi:hypothetical protein